MIPDPLPDAASPSEVSYLALDPGDTCGYAQFDHSGLLLTYGQFKGSDPKFLRRLIHEGLTKVIVEDYKNHPGMRQPTWSRNNTSKIIGQIEMICELRGISMVLQPNTLLKIGYLWAGLEEKPSNHSISHQFDAVAHGTWYLVKNNIIKPVGLGSDKS